MAERATTKIILRPDRKALKGEVGIYVQVCIKSRVKLYPTKQKCLPELWDAASQQIRKRVGSRDYLDKNAKISQRKTEIDTIINNAIVNRIPLSFEYISVQLGDKSKKSVPSESEVQRDFFAWYELYIQAQATHQSKEITKHRRTNLNHLKAYFNQTKQKPGFDTINFEFYNRFRSWLIEELELANSSVNKQIDYLKGFLGYAAAQGLFSADILKTFKRLTEYETYKIFITQQELKRLWEFDFGDNKRLERVRDLFVFACTTGLRESDFSNIKPENIQDDAIRLTSIKTRDPLTVPLTEYSRAILKKYDNQLPTYSQQKFNDYLKEVGKAVGITTPERVVTFKKGQRYEETVPKYKLLSSHTGRRTFITQSILRGIPIPVIQSITGHRDLKSFQKYIRLTDTEKYEQMQSKWKL